VSEQLTGITREYESEEVMSLLRIAEGLLAAQDLAAARLVLRRAAEAGNARAALLLGESYDAHFRRQFDYNPDVDRTTARTWYEVARKLGSTDARQRLNRLAHDEPGGDLPSRP
jgi:TPR repeat protein